MFNLREYREPTHRLPDHLPWAALVAPGVVLQKDALFQQTIAFRGPDLASSLDSEFVSAIARLNNGLRRLGSGWSLFLEAQRFASNDYPAGTWSHPAAYVVDYERQQSFHSHGQHFESSYYLTFVWGLPPDSHNRVAAYFYEDPDAKPDHSTSLLRDLEYFQRTVAEITNLLKGVFPEVGALDDEQTLSYLHSTIPRRTATRSGSRRRPCTWTPSCRTWR